MTAARRRRQLLWGFSWTALGLGLACAAAPGCAKHATSAECSALLDRYVELLVREREPRSNDTEILRQKERTREKASTDPSFASCPKEVTSRELRCAMDAPNVDEFEKCLE